MTTWTGLRQQLDDSRSLCREYFEAFKAEQQRIIEIAHVIAALPDAMAKLSPETQEHLRWAALCDLPEIENL